jgi:signal transduction histidine kinase
MKHFFYNLWIRLERISVLGTDSPGDKRQKVTLVMIAIFCCLTGLLSITQGLVTSRPFIEVLMPFIFTIVVGTALFTYFFTKRFDLLLYPFLIMILFIPIFFQMSIGGFSGQGSVPIIFWSILAPFGSLMFQNIRKATWWFFAYLVLVFIFLIIDEQFTKFAEFPISFAELTTSHSELMVGHGITIIVLSIIIFVSMGYFVNAFQKEHSRAEILVVDLTETNRELETTLTELKETQTELVQSEKMAALGKLAAGFAHEINNPIGALKSSADISTRCLSKMKQLFEESEEFADIKTDAGFQNVFKILKDNSEVFSSASDRVATTVNSFINFARLDEAEFDKVDIHQGINNTLMLIQHEIKEGTGFVKEYGDIPQVACYPGELNQVFMHLLTNAAQAIEGEGEIAIRTFVEKENVHVQIADTGVGISPEQMQGLFDPGFTKKGSRMKAGLGLFTSYSIMQKHRGQIKVESKVGKGSTFTVVLPMDLKGQANY